MAWAPYGWLLAVTVRAVRPGKISWRALAFRSATSLVKPVLWALRFNLCIYRAVSWYFVARTVVAVVLIQGRSARRHWRKHLWWIKPQNTDWCRLRTGVSTGPMVRIFINSVVWTQLTCLVCLAAPTANFAADLTCLPSIRCWYHCWSVIGAFIAGLKHIVIKTWCSAVVQFR